MLFGALSTLSKNVSFTVYHFDYDVDDKNKYVWKKKQEHKPLRTRSGGTNFEAVEDHYRKHASEFDGYIIMTDGEAGKPKSCISKRCWLVLPNRSLAFKHDNRDTVVNMKL